MANQSGTLYSYNVDQTGNSVPAAVGASADLRRIHNFGDRVAELAPDESPFFVYLNKVAKVPTNDPVFRFLENRSKIDWTSRNFFIDGTAISDVAVDSTYSLTVEAAKGGSGTSNQVSWLVKGMVFAVETNDSGAPSQVNFRVESVTHNTNDTTVSARAIAETGSTNVAAHDHIADEDECQVIGTSFAEGSGSPDVWSSQLDDDFGYTQIFKTSAEMTNTAIATNYRGYADEWNRIWNLKLREHKVDIERAMLFGMRARSNSVQYSEGLVGHILQNGESAAFGSASYSSGAPYFLSGAASTMIYDDLLGDFEVIFDPARGGNKSKLALASRPVLTFFNKMGSTGFVDQSVAADKMFQYDITSRNGQFGHQVMQVNTIHGDLSMVAEPLFRGIASGYMALVDLDQVAYRPLVGNGLNRDTHIITNVQQADEDLRKDMIVTEAGLEITIPETHALYSFDDL